MVEQLKRQKDQKEREENEKKRRQQEKASKQKKPTQKTKRVKVSETRPQPVVSSSDDDDNVSIHDSSDDCSVDMDGGGDFGITLPLAEPTNDDWIGVKVEMQQVGYQEGGESRSPLLKYILAEYNLLTVVA